MTTDPVRAWRDLEVYLLRLLRDELVNLNWGSAGYYDRQLAALRRVMGKAHTRVRVTEDLVREGIDRSVIDAYTAAYQGVGAVPQAIPTAAVTAIVTDAVGVVGSQGAAILRGVEDAYREITETVARRVVGAGVTHERALQDALNLFADRGITAYIDSSGRRWGIDTYADMSLRTARHRAQNEGRRDGYQAAGIDLILVSWHHACAPMCLPYQGRVLSMTRGPGTYTMVSEVTGDPVQVEVVERWDVAISKGYQHVNCRHTETAYIPGTPLPDMPTIGEGEHEVLQRQRAIERHIRRWKKRGEVALTPGERDRARGKVRAWQAAQREHVKAHRYLTRRYDREQVRV